MPRIEFEADTEEALLALAWRWVMGPQRLAGGTVADPADQADLRRRQLGEVLNAIRGPDSRRLLREVAELSMQDAALVLDANLDRSIRQADRHRLRRHRGGPEQGDAARRASRPCHLGRRCAWLSDGSGRRGDRPAAMADAIARRRARVTPLEPSRYGDSSSAAPAQGWEDRRPGCGPAGGPRSTRRVQGAIPPAPAHRPGPGGPPRNRDW